MKEDVTDGKQLNETYFKDAADTARGIGAQTVGCTTNERAAFLDSLLREEGRHFLAHLSSESNVGQRLNELLKGLLYSTSNIRLNTSVRFRPKADIHQIQFNVCLILKADVQRISVQRRAAICRAATGRLEFTRVYHAPYR